MKTKFRVKKKVFNSLSLLTFICILISACQSSKSKEDNKNDVASSVPTVLVAQARNENFQNNISIAGTAMANQEIKVYAITSGYVSDWKHDIGDVVRKGEVLAHLSNPQLLEQEKKARAELDGDKAIYDRLEGVYKKTPELTPLEDVDEARAKYESAVAEVNAIDSQIHYLVVTAPFDGVLTDRYIDIGDVVQDGLSRSGTNPLFKLQDISIIRINVNVPEVNTPYITKGTAVNIVFPDLPNTVFQGTVSRVSNGLSEDAKTMLAQIDISNKEDKIHPGMFATVNFHISSQLNVLSVPNEAITTIEQELFVYKAIPIDSTISPGAWGNGVKCHIQKVEIKLGIANATNSEVEYANLKAGDRIVIGGKNQCSEGAIVLAKETASSPSLPQKQQSDSTSVHQQKQSAKS